MIADYEIWKLSQKDYLESILISFFGTALVNFICYRSIWAFLVFLPAFILNLRISKKKKAEKRRRTFFYHFRDFIASLRSSLRSGYSVENAVRDSVYELEQIYGKEDVLVQEVWFMRNKMEMNVPVEKLLSDLGRRTGIEEVRSFASVLSIAKRTGGNMAEVLDHTWEIFCLKIDTWQEIEGLIASRKYEMTVMSAVPFGILLYVQIAFPSFLEVLYGNIAGALIMTGCLLIYLAAIWIEEKILRIEV